MSKRQKTKEIDFEWKPPSYNAWTNKPFSPKYYTILEKRKELPVWNARSNVLELVNKHQVIILQGETGSGKTT